ncbi:hypothetical protein F2Q69_00037653 [Brassica cretica]|uniref:Kelch repeat-containing protein n=1 Tax=Brassica cretica TaxID=69181 RepID=A0A8S9SCH7_BRACR|nr:hypothetical protein F2Q69_00037653 [Brassica cretica]
MARQAGKQSYGRLVLVSCLALLAVGLIADFLWASSHRFSPAGTYLPSSLIEKLPPESNEKDTKTKERKLSATFQDLDAPQLQWEKMAAAPVPRLDGAAIQIRNLLYVFAGYGNINLVHSHVDIYNFVDNKWGGRFDMPKEMAHSHLGMVTDGRYIYIVTGQYGPQCRGPTAKTFVLDTDTNTWSDFVPLPVPRYAPATQLWRGRLHVMGGSKENRHTPGLEHWSIAVKDGKALEKVWRSEIPIPRGGPHRACVVVDDRLFVIGGQEGDFMAKPGSPIFKCSRRLEVVFSDVYMLDEDMKWKVMPPLPKPDSHIEFAWKVVNNSIVIVGGTTEKHPETKKMVLVGEIFQFNLYAPATQLWRGRLHVMGGSKENRHTPGLEHWSIAVKDGKALEKVWRSEIPIPRGGPHRACVVVDDRLFVIGGQEGDFMAKPGSPIFKCSRRLEVVFSDVYMLDEDMKWKVMPPLPKPDSHIEFAWKVVNNSIVIVGGTTEKHPETKKMVLVGEIFQFNLYTMKWYVIGKLPYRVKTTLVGYWDGQLYFTSGQRDKGPDDPAPRKVVAEMWRTKLILYP